MSSCYSGNIRISLFGQSHSGGIGCVINGLPVGETIDMEVLQRFLDRRSPGKNAWSTARSEADAPMILSGIANGKTCGAPLCAVIQNANTRSQDYDNIRDIPRPGHADYTAQIKYGGHQDVSGGGHFSGRLTAALCVAGGICKQILERKGIAIGAHLLSIADISDRSYDSVSLDKATLLSVEEKSFPVLEDMIAEEMQRAILSAKQEGDSVGGIIECAAIGVPAGLGDPMFDGMENRIARIVFAIPAVKGIEFGAGFEVAKLRGSENNDDFCMDENHVRTKSNHCGGILGGITNGMPILFRAAIKPTPSIAKPQQSISLSRMENATLEIHGRHDPCIAPRAVPCMEAALAIAIMDAILESKRNK